MTTNPFPQVTDFSRDVLGRYVCNGLDEAINSTPAPMPPNTPLPGARHFDLIVIGGGTFGAALAQHLFFRDQGRTHRILVLEGGPMVLPEHFQNLPMIGLGVADKIHLATLQQWQQQGNVDAIRKWSKEVWGLTWHSPEQFPGLAYCLGGRSLFWGGWSPQLLDAEMTEWPATTVSDLKASFFRRASEQIGVTETNDFIHGPLHDALRQRLFDGLTATPGKVSDAIPLAQLPLHLEGIPAGSENLFKLEAPLAVQTRLRSGFFPFNKFSTVPLLIKAARAAANEAVLDDVKKRLMVVPNCHVKQLLTTGGRVTKVVTNLGDVTVPDNGAVVIALGTIESARLALLSFDGIPNQNLMGRNLMAHLRSNLDLRIPRTALAIDPSIKELQASALFVKGRHTHADGSVGHFHLQITACGLGAFGTNSEAELFQKVPDIDGFDQLHAANDTHVVITIRGIGEMTPQNPNNTVRLDPQVDEFGVPRAIVSLAPGANDQALWNAMDKAALDVANLFANGQTLEILRNARDTMGTTHHETGTLWMGDDATTSVTNADGRFHHVANAYVAGPALFPTIGSPNPMLTGVALARRLAKRLIPDPQLSTTPDGFQQLFDGFSTSNWRMAGAGSFIVTNQTLEAVPGTELGLFWCTQPTPSDFILKLEWLRHQSDNNSGVLVRFPDPNSKGYNNPAYVGVHFGFEVQIDELGRPDGAAMHTTGAIYSEPNQTLSLQPALPVGQWNEYEIRIKGQTYTVLLNGTQVTTFQNTQAGRGVPGGFIGLQAYPGSRVSFRNIRIKAL